MGKRSKVFVGISNTAGCAYFIARSLRLSGINAISYAYSVHIYKYPIDKIIFQVKYFDSNSPFHKRLFNKFFSLLNNFLRGFFFVCALAKFNTFFFISTKTMLRNNKDLPILIFFHKKVIFFFIGCPERNPLSNINSKGICGSCNDLHLKNSCLCNQADKKKELIQLLERYSNYIMGSPDVRGFLQFPERTIQGYAVSNEYFNDDILDKFHQPRIIISHIPSNEKLKRSKEIEEIIIKLQEQRELNIEYISRANISNEESLQILEKSHILIDQFSGLHGLVSVEAMARGCVVIAKIADWFKEARPGLPIVNTDISNLQETLQELIQDKALMLSLAKKSLLYYQNMHSPQAVGRYYKERLNLY